MNHVDIDAAVLKASDELRKEIDAQCLANLYIDAGWTVCPGVDYKNAKMITEWCKEHSPKAWHIAGNRVLFKYEKDAIMFIMRWT